MPEQIQGFMSLVYEEVEFAIKSGNPPFAALQNTRDYTTELGRTLLHLHQRDTQLTSRSGKVKHASSAMILLFGVKMNRKVIFLLFILINCSALTIVRATPAQVVLLRHAEKPEVGDTLSKKGFERAVALVSFFTQPPTAANFKQCAAVYAPRSSKNHASTRSIQTVSALANVFEVPFYVKYTVGDVEELASEIMNEPSYEGKMVLICWQHERISMIAECLGVSHPDKWPKKAFDRVWVINCVDNKVSSFQDLPQQLLPGDSSK